MSTRVSPERWHLEIVRGREPGRSYVLLEGETILGNALAGVAGVDLANQETPTSPRRMAGHQACLTSHNGILEIRDLESPGGTFVNRQRLFVGQTRTLQPGDIIQLGSVQLAVARETSLSSTSCPKPTPPPPPTKAPSSAGTKPEPAPTAAITGSVRRQSREILPQPYTIAGGSTCRSWDDFLTLAAQRWSVLRDELTSGRLSAYLRRTGHAELLPQQPPGASDDDQLDAWLARIPTSLPSAPELDVHPRSLVVRSASGGGTVRRSITVTNVGYRLLRSRARAEPSSAPFRLAPEDRSGPFITIDRTELAVEIDLPEIITSTRLGAIVIESNGGTSRVEVQLERPTAVSMIPDLDGPIISTANLDPMSQPILARLRSMPLGRRLVIAIGGFLLLRILIMAAGLLPLGSAASHVSEPRLGPIALVMAALGTVAGLTLGSRGADRRDIIAIGFAGLLVGFFTAAIGYAVVRSCESLLGGWALWPPAVLSLWAILSAALALLSWRITPAPSTDTAQSLTAPAARSAEGAP